MPQVKVTIDDKIYKQLKKAAKENFRTITNELNYRLQQSFTTPAPTPTYIPYNTPGGIPVEPYKITLQTDTTSQPKPQPAPATTTQTGEPIGTVYKSNHTPQLTITDDDFDEPEPEWDADRGGARPRVL